MKIYGVRQIEKSIRLASLLLLFQSGIIIGKIRVREKLVRKGGFHVGEKNTEAYGGRALCTSAGSRGEDESCPEYKTDGVSLRQYRKRKDHFCGGFSGKKTVLLYTMRGKEKRRNVRIDSF